MAGDELSQLAAPFMAVLQDPRASKEQQELAAIRLSELMNRNSGGARAIQQQIAVAREEMKRMPPESPKEKALRMIDLLVHSPGSDPRDYLVESGLWASQLLPMGVSIDQAARDGIPPWG